MQRKFKRTGKYYAYILECQDGTYYTGYTSGLEKRIKLHNSGRGAKYTRDRRPVKLVWCKEYKYFKKAFSEERRIKTLTREQKDKLVSGAKNRKVAVTPNSKRRKNPAAQSCGAFFSPEF